MSLEIRNPIGAYSPGVRFDRLPSSERAEKYASHVTEIRKRADELEVARARVTSAKTALTTVELAVDAAEREYAKARAAFDEFMPPVVDASKSEVRDA